MVHALHMKHDPISDALRLKQPLPISELKPMRSFLDKEHISLQLNPTSAEAPEPSQLKQVHFEDEDPELVDDDRDNDSESEAEDEDD